MSDDLVCDAGRIAFYGGRWAWPCLNQPVRHRLAFSDDIGGSRADGTPIMHFCDEHAEQLIFDGSIDEALVDEDEWDRRTPRRSHD